MSNSICIVTNIPRPYRRALFSAVDDRLQANGLQLRVIYTSDPSKHVRRGSGTPAANAGHPEQFVRSMSFRLAYDRVVSIPTGLARALGKLMPAGVVVGGFGTDAILSARWCRTRRIPLIVWSGAWPGREGAVGRIKSATRRHLVQRADAFIAYGTAAAGYLATVGAPTDRVFYAWNTVDLEGIAGAAREAAARRPQLTDKYGLAAKNLLYVGTLVESKGLLELISAALAIGAPSSDWALHLVGAGPLREELESKVRTAGKQSHFRFHGLRPESDVAELLGVADGFVLPTKREAWGLVINEAMACGVPVVASPQAGATRDLIEDGVTGFVVDPDDKQKLAATMSRLLTDDPDCERIGQAGGKAVRERASLDRAAEGFVSAIMCALEGSDGD